MKSKEFLRTDRSMSKACFVPGPRAEVSLRMFQPVQKAEKIISNCWTTSDLWTKSIFCSAIFLNNVSHTNQQQNQYNINYPTCILGQVLTLLWAVAEWMPSTSLMRSYTTVTNTRTVLISARLFISCLSNILVTRKEPLFCITNNTVSYHTVVVPWSKKISCQKTTAGCVQEFDSFSTMGRFVTIDCALANKEK